MSKFTDNYLARNPLPKAVQAPALRHWRHGRSGWRVSAMTLQEACDKIGSLTKDKSVIKPGDITEITPVYAAKAGESGEITGWVNAITGEPIDLEQIG